jgi:hypothetical protein
MSYEMCEAFSPVRNGPTFIVFLRPPKLGRDGTRKFYVGTTSTASTSVILDCI